MMRTIDTIMPEQHPDMAIELSNIQFGYSKKNGSILNIPSWAVNTGEQVFIHGASGSGKSTLLNLLSGLLSATTGQVSILGQRLDQMSSQQRDRFRANHIGYVSQQFNLIPYLNAIENIKLANHFSNQASASNTEIDQLLSTLNIPAAQTKKPVHNMSIGQQQRIAIARALINKPALLIADEPTSSLDKDNSDNFMALLKTMASKHKTTLIFVSHDLSLAQHFNRVEALNEINTPEVASHVS